MRNGGEIPVLSFVNHSRARTLSSDAIETIVASRKPAFSSWSLLVLRRTLQPGFLQSNGALEHRSLGGSHHDGRLADPRCWSIISKQIRRWYWRSCSLDSILKGWRTIQPQETQTQETKRIDMRLTNWISKSFAKWSLTFGIAMIGSVALDSQAHAHHPLEFPLRRLFQFLRLPFVVRLSVILVRLFPAILLRQLLCACVLCTGLLYACLLCTRILRSNLLRSDLLCTSMQLVEQHQLQRQFPTCK
jgi:hypothetical protein